MRRNIKNIFEQLKSDLPTHIKHMRLDAGLTQKELAAKLPSGIGGSTVSNWEKGHGDVSFSNFIIICIVCGKSPLSYIGDVLKRHKLSHRKERRKHSE